MVVLNKIYTRTGDDGTTALGTGARVPKHSQRIAAYGTVDEVNAAIGVARQRLADPAGSHADLDAILVRIQNDLFDLGADLCAPEEAATTSQRQRLRVSDVQVRRLEEAIAMHTRRPEKAEPAPRLDLTTLRGRRWVTRPRPHVDRVASAWLIKRFIDSEAVFVFAPPAEFPEDAIPYDAPGVELSHQGEDCTFETLIKRANLRDRRLTRLAEVVHEADLRDGKYPHEEARGIDVAIRALLAAAADDHQVLAQGMMLFEGLYANTSGKR